jgi:hypothetical protein
LATQRWTFDELGSGALYARAGGHAVVKDIVFLRVVKQKVTKIQLWKPRIHQLLLYVGTPRQGHGAKQRMKENNAARQVKQRWS